MGKQGKGRSGTLTEGESRARLSFRLESDHNDVVVTSLQLQHCPGAHSERQQSSLSLLLDWLTPLELLWLCTDVGSGFISPASHFDFSAATHALKDEHICEFARLQSHRQDLMGLSFTKNWVCASVCSPRSPLKARSSPAVVNSSVPQVYFA